MEKLYTKIITTVESGIIEWHHIIPKHDGGNNDVTNLVPLSRRNHILAHFVRYRWLGQAGDYAAYKMMTSQLTNPMLCDEIKVKHKKIMNSKIVKDKIIYKSNLRWNNPEERNNQSIRRKRYIEENPDFREKLIKQINNREVWDKVGTSLKKFYKTNPTRANEIIHIRAEARKEKNKTRSTAELQKIYSRGSGSDNPNWQGYCYLIKSGVVVDKFDSITEFDSVCPYHICTIKLYRDTQKPMKKGKWAGCTIKITKEIL